MQTLFKPVLFKAGKALRRVAAGSSGFTLIEVVIAVGLVSLATGMIGAGLFRVTSLQRFWTDDVVATKNLRHAGSWFAGDALNAEDVLDSGGVTRLTCDPNPPVREITLSWIDTAGGSHTANYRVVVQNGQNHLERSFNGTQLTMSDRVVGNSLSFSLCGGSLTMLLAVEADRDSTEPLSLRTQVRKLP